MTTKKWLKLGLWFLIIICCSFSIGIILFEIPRLAKGIRSPIIKGLEEKRLPDNLSFISDFAEVKSLSFRCIQHTRTTQYYLTTKVNYEKLNNFIKQEKLIATQHSWATAPPVIKNIYHELNISPEEQNRWNDSYHWIQGDINEGKCSILIAYDPDTRTIWMNLNKRKG